MCLITEQFDPKIAEEDITTYKVVKYISDDLVAAVLWSFTYRYGFLYSTEIEDSEHFSWYDDKAEESYTEVSNDKLKVIGPGFHSVRSIRRLDDLTSYKNIIVECTVPKGSEYFEDRTDVLVSNQIIINRVVPQDESPTK